MLNEPAARILNPAAFAGDTLFLCLVGASCGVAGITYMGGCEPEITAAGGAGTCSGEGGDVDGTRGGGVPGVGEKPGTGGMVNLLPSLLHRIRGPSFVRQTVYSTYGRHVELIWRSK